MRPFLKGGHHAFNSALEHGGHHCLKKLRSKFEIDEEINDASLFGFFEFPIVMEMVKWAIDIFDLNCSGSAIENITSREFLSEHLKPHG